MLSKKKKKSNDSYNTRLVYNSIILLSTGSLGYDIHTKTIAF